MLCISFSVVALQSNNTSPQNQSPQQTIEQLQKESEDMQKQLTVLEKELDKYRDDIRLNLTIWFSILTIIMALLGAGLGIVMPYVINSRNEKNMQRKLDEVIEQAKIASENAQNATNQVTIIEGLKQDIENIKSIIDISKDQAERAALDAKASEYFSQALAEKDAVSAIGLYSKAIEIRPNFFDAYFNRGCERLKMDDYNGAMNDFLKVIELNSNDARAYNNIAHLLHTRHLLDQALSNVNKAIELDSTVSTYYLNRGVIYMSKGNLREALDDFTEAIRINENNADSYKSRARCYTLLAVTEKDKEKQANYLKKAEEDNNKVIELETSLS